MPFSNKCSNSLITELERSLWMFFWYNSFPKEISQPPFICSNYSEWKRQNNLYNLFKVHNKDIRTTSTDVVLMCFLITLTRFLTYFYCCYQINADWHWFISAVSKALTMGKPKQKYTIITININSILYFHQSTNTNKNNK